MDFPGIELATSKALIVMSIACGDQKWVEETWVEGVEIEVGEGEGHTSVEPH